MYIEENLQTIRTSIELNAQKYGRKTDEVKLLAVSKTKTTEAILSCLHAGQSCFGENYVQEGVDKVNYFKEHHPEWAIEWHFIGDLQSNKTKVVANHFDWVQTLSRLKIAKRLNDQRSDALNPLNVLIQVNISQEESKSGIEPSELLEFAHQLQPLTRLKLRGLMVIPKPETDPQKQFEILSEAKRLFDDLKQIDASIDTLSMGMSNDMDMAIKAGSTMVRVGTAIFGSRN